MTTVEYCLANVDRTTLERLRARDATEKTCLQRCGDCASGAVLVVDGTLRTAEDHATLLADLDGEPDAGQDDWNTDRDGPDADSGDDA